MEFGGRQIAAPTREFGRCALGFVGAVINRPHGRVLRFRIRPMCNGRLCRAGGRLPPLRGMTGVRMEFGGGTKAPPYEGIRFGVWNSAGGRLPPLRILSLVIVGRGFTPAG